MKISGFLPSREERDIDELSPAAKGGLDWWLQLGGLHYAV